MVGDDSEDLYATEAVGIRLLRAREAMGLSRADIAAQTHIQVRFLQAIEEGDYGVLPARTYTIGFARTYAAKVGLDPALIVRDLRIELDGSAPQSAELSTPAFMPGDPARVPSTRFALIATVAAVIVAGGGYLLWQTYYVPDANLPSLVTDAPPAPPRSASAPMPSPSATSAAELTGPVVFTAQDPVWVKFYDAAGKTLLNKQMAAGETYTVPADAVGPMLTTGRPEALAVTIGGHPVAKLADTRQTLRDAPVSAAALQARVAASGGPSSSGPSSSPPSSGPASGMPMAMASMAAKPMPSPAPAKLHRPVLHQHLPAAAATDAPSTGASPVATKASTVSE